MTRRATGQLGRRANFVFCRQLFTDFSLIGWRLPVHVENLIVWPQHVLRIAMAVQAPRHLQRRRLKHERHLIHLPVTRGAAYALGHVNAVIEIDIIGQTVNTDPVNRLIGAITLSNRLQITRAVKQHGMTVHACFRRWNACRRRELDTRMAVPAIDAVVADVVLVAELNGLISRYILIRQNGRTRRHENACQRQTRQEKRRKDTEPGDEIRAAVKNLRHVYVCTLEVSAPEGSGYLGDQILSGMCGPESKF
jgi:hypothetical protein